VTVKKPLCHSTLGGVAHRRKLRAARRGQVSAPAPRSPVRGKPLGCEPAG
jgi:hypothetical protein